MSLNAAFHSNVARALEAMINKRTWNQCDCRVVQSAVSNAASLIPEATETANIEEEGEKKPQLFYTTESGRALCDPITTVRLCACVCLCARMRVCGGNGDFCTHGDKMGGLPAA